jgi:general secretion pathway protein G
MKPQASPPAGRRHSLLGVLGWLLPLAVAIAAGLWLSSHRQTDEVQRVAKARDQIRAITAALLAPRADGAGLPDTGRGLAALVEDGILPHIPLDPWGRPYQYRNPGSIQSWELYSLGPDGVDSADDIVSWNLYGGR